MGDEFDGGAGPASLSPNGPSERLVRKASQLSFHVSDTTKKFRIPHVLIEKAFLYDELEALVGDVRADGAVPRHLLTLANLLTRILQVGLGCDDYTVHEKRPLSEHWPQVAGLLGITGRVSRVDDSIIDEATAHVMVARWVVRNFESGSLHSELMRCTSDDVKLNHMYHPVSFMRLEKDRSAFLELICKLQSTSDARGGPPSQAQMGNQWKKANTKDLGHDELLFAKNNVGLDDVGYTSQKQWRRLSNAPGEMPLTGYLTVLEHVQDDGMSTRTESPSLGILDTVEGPVESGRVCWTPNDALNSLEAVAAALSLKELEAEKEELAPLPPGWDMAYDPVTGCHYYIDHVTKVTTWERPTMETESTQAEGGEKSQTEDDESAIKTIEFEVTKDSPAIVFVSTGGEDSEYGVATFIAFDVHGTLPGARFTVPRGSLVSLCETLGRLAHCTLLKHAPRSDVNPESTSESPSDPPSVTDLEPPSLKSELVTMDTWKSFVNEEGQYLDWDALRKLVFFRGLHPNVRPILWPMLLGLYPKDSNKKDRDRILGEIHEVYGERKRGWLLTPVRESKTVIHRIKDVYKDVVRTDREHAFYSGSTNPNLIRVTDILTTYCTGEADGPVTYVQGMSDILAPIFMVMRDEAVALKCFEKNLERLSKYFDGGSGMHELLETLRLLASHYLPTFYDILCQHDMVSMFFAYRWMLLDFKREFPLTDALAIWETVWCAHRTKCFHLFVALAIMKVYGPNLSMGPTTNILEYFTQLGGSMDVSAVLVEARELLYSTQVGNCPPQIAAIVEADRSRYPTLTEYESLMTSNGSSNAAPSTLPPDQPPVVPTPTSPRVPEDEYTVIPANEISTPIDVEELQGSETSEGEATLEAKDSVVDNPEDVTSEPIMPVQSVAPPVTSPTDVFVMTSGAVATPSPAPTEIPSFPPELLGTAPPEVVDECNRAFGMDARGEFHTAVHTYLHATDILLQHIKTLPKGDIHAKPLKKFVRFLLMRADHLKHSN